MFPTSLSGPRKALALGFSDLAYSLFSVRNLLRYEWLCRSEIGVDRCAEPLGAVDQLRERPEPSYI
jgi:hypothetical protein